MHPYTERDLESELGSGLQHAPGDLPQIFHSHMLSGRSHDCEFQAPKKASAWIQKFAHFNLFDIHAVSLHLKSSLMYI